MFALSTQSITALQQGALDIIALAQECPELSATAQSLASKIGQADRGHRVIVTAPMRLDLGQLRHGLFHRGRALADIDKTLSFARPLWENGGAQAVPFSETPPTEIGFLQNPSWLRRFHQAQQPIYRELFCFWEEVNGAYDEARDGVGVGNSLHRIRAELTRLYQYPDLRAATDLTDRLKTLAHQIQIPDLEGGVLFSEFQETRKKGVPKIYDVYRRMRWDPVDNLIRQVLAEKYQNQPRVMAIDLGLNAIDTEDLMAQARAAVSRDGVRCVSRMATLLDLNRDVWQRAVFDSFPMDARDARDSAINFLRLSLDYYMLKEGRDHFHPEFDIDRGFGREHFTIRSIGQSNMNLLASSLYYYFLNCGEEVWAQELARRLDEVTDYRFEWDQSPAGLGSVGLTGFEAWGGEKLARAKVSRERVYFVARYLGGAENHGDLASPRLVTEDEFSSVRFGPNDHKIPLQWNGKGEFWEIGQSSQRLPSPLVLFLESGEIARRSYQQRLADIRHVDELRDVLSNSNGLFPDFFRHLVEETTGEPFDETKTHSFFLNIDLVSPDRKITASPTFHSESRKKYPNSTSIPITIHGTNVMIGDEMRGSHHLFIAEALENAGVSRRSCEQRLRDLHSCSEIERLSEESNGLWRDIFTRHAQTQFAPGRTLQAGDVFHLGIRRPIADDGHFATDSILFNQGPVDFSHYIDVPLVWNGEAWEFGELVGDQAHQVAHALERAGFVRRSFRQRLVEVRHRNDMENLLTQTEGMWGNFLNNLILEKKRGVALEVGETFRLVGISGMTAEGIYYGDLVLIGPGEEIPTAMQHDRYAHISLTWMGNSFLVEVNNEKIGRRRGLAQIIANSQWAHHAPSLSQRFVGWLEDYFTAAQEPFHATTLVYDTGIQKTRFELTSARIDDLRQHHLGTWDLYELATALYQNLRRVGRVALADEIIAFMNELCGHRLHWDRNVKALGELTVEEFEALNPEEVRRAKMNFQPIYFVGYVPTRRFGVPGVFQGPLYLGPQIPPSRDNRYYFCMELLHADGAWYFRFSNHLHDGQVANALERAFARRTRPDDWEGLMRRPGQITLQSLRDMGAEYHRFEMVGAVLGTNLKERWLRGVNGRLSACGVVDNHLDDDLAISRRDRHTLNHFRFHWNHPAVLSLARAVRVYTPEILQCLIEANGGASDDDFALLGFGPADLAQDVFYVAPVESIAEDIARRQEILHVMTKSELNVLRSPDEELVARFGYENDEALESFLHRTGGTVPEINRLSWHQICYLFSIGDVFSTAMWLYRHRASRRIPFFEIVPDGLVRAFENHYRRWLIDVYDVRFDPAENVISSPSRRVPFTLSSPRLLDDLNKIFEQNTDRRSPNTD